MTPEQRSAYNAAKLEAVVNWRANQPPELLAKYKEKTRQNQKNAIANFTPEQRAAYNEKNRINQQRYRDRKAAMRSSQPIDVDIDAIDVDNLNIPDDFDIDNYVPQKRRRGPNKQPRKSSSVSPGSPLSPAHSHHSPAHSYHSPAHSYHSPAHSYHSPAHSYHSPAHSHHSPAYVPLSPAHKEDYGLDLDLFDYLEDPGFDS
jgi:hypothetical protein